MEARRDAFRMGKTQIEANSGRRQAVRGSCTWLQER
jgi:hypothetical protein